MSASSLLILFLDALYLSHSQWISPTSSNLSHYTYFAGAGYYDNIIYLIGGVFNYDYSGRALTQYNIANDTFSYDPSFFPISISLYGLGQWWYQMGHMMYLSGNSDPDIISTFNLATKLFNPDSFSVPTKHQGRGRYSCLTGDPIESLLYYIGGRQGGSSGNFSTGNYSNNLHILNIHNNSWIRGPNMNTPRGYFSCIVSPNKRLYAIGGHNGDDFLASIEVISTIDIKNNHWSHIQNLSDPSVESRTVSLDHYVYIIGGWLGGQVHTNKVHIIDTLSNEVYISDDRLVYGNCCMSPIIVDRMIYSFAGWMDPYYPASGPWAKATRRWQYISISSEEPTSEPSISPSDNSRSPTITPTNEPSSLPSGSPTIDPTMNPTSDATLDATIDPSPDPMMDPTADPTFYPTRDSSESPSIAPTMNEYNEGSQDDFSDVFGEYGIVSFILCIVLIICISSICAYTGFICWKKKKSAKMTKNLQIISIETDNKSDITKHPVKIFLKSIDQNLDGECYDKFIANGWNTMERICMMDNEDLKDMDILAGQRKLILLHIQKYDTSMNPGQTNLRSQNTDDHIQNQCTQHLDILNINSNSSFEVMSDIDPGGKDPNMGNAKERIEHPEEHQQYDSENNVDEGVKRVNIAHFEGNPNMSALPMMKTGGSCVMNRMDKTDGCV